VAYGVVTIPVYWLQDFTSYDFNVISALSILFSVITNILVALLNIYVPFCMREHAATVKASVRDNAHTVDVPASGVMVNADNIAVEDPKKRTYGFKMTVFGSFANSIGALVMYIVVCLKVTRLVKGSETVSWKHSRSCPLRVLGVRDVANP
jgi:hypothetical protein